jgi:hypothetical protein
MSDLHDVKAQQTALGVPLIRLEQQVPGPGYDAPTLHAANPPKSPLPVTGNVSIVLLPLGADHRIMPDAEGRTATGSTMAMGTTTLCTRLSYQNSTVRGSNAMA